MKNYFEIEVVVLYIPEINLTEKKEYIYWNKKPERRRRGFSEVQLYFGELE